MIGINGLMYVFVRLLFAVRIVLLCVARVARFCLKWVDDSVFNALAVSPKCRTSIRLAP